MKSLRWLMCSWAVSCFLILIGYPAFGKGGSGNFDCNEAVTGAHYVFKTGGEGALSCEKLRGPYGDKMKEVHVAIVESDDSGLNVTSEESFDVVAVGQGQRCIYFFYDAKSASGLRGGSGGGGNSVLACSDGKTDPLADLPVPISTERNCDDELSGIQEAVDEEERTDLAILFGQDDDPVGDVFGVCTDDDDQAGCLPACREPTSKEYGCPGTLDSGHLCLNERTCATSDELPTGDPLQPQYCWEKRDRVDLEEGTFWPRTESEETTIISVQKFPGSNCYWVTANYYGIWYGWWQCV